MGLRSLCVDVAELIKDALKLRMHYFAASKLRLLALALLVALLVTMLAIPEMNLTGTRWATFLPALVGYLTARLSTGVALFDHAHLFHQGDEYGFGVADDLSNNDEQGVSAF